jgi:hypothetical protein
MDRSLVSARSESPSPNYLVHVCRNDDGLCAVHDLEAHLRAVGGMAQCVIARRGLRWAETDVRRE